MVTEFRMRLWLGRARRNAGRTERSGSENGNKKFAHSAGSDTTGKGEETNLHLHAGWPQSRGQLRL